MTLANVAQGVDSLGVQIALGIAPPIVVAALVLGVRWLRLRGTDAAGDRALALALGGAVLVTYVAVDSWPAWPPVHGTHSLIWTVVAATLLATAWPPRRLAIAWWPAAAALVAFGTWHIVRRVAESWSTAEIAGQLAAATALALVLALAHRAVGARGAPLACAQATLLFAGAGPVVASGSALLGQLAGGAAAACGVATVAGLLDRGLRFERAAGLVSGLTLTGLMLAAHRFAEVELDLLAWVAAASLAGATAATALRRAKGWVAWVAVLGVTGGLLAAGVAQIPVDPYGY